MKKIFAMLLASMMVLGLGTGVFANEVQLEVRDPNEGKTDGFVDEQTAIITKYYILTNDNDYAQSPAETITFEFSGAKVTENTEATTAIPQKQVVDAEGKPVFDAEGNPKYEEDKPYIEPLTLAVDDAEPGAGKKHDLVIHLPSYTEVGVYTYTFTEKGTWDEDGNKLAGVTYYETVMTLVVTVVQEADGKVRVAAVHCESPVNPSYNTSTNEGNTDEGTSQEPGNEDDATLPEKPEKTDVFNNYYAAANLTVTKALEGNLAEKDQYFTVEVNFTLPEDTYRADNQITYNITTANNETAHADNPDSVSVETVNTFKIKGGETINFFNIPYGVSYTVSEVEANQNGYTTTYKLDKGEFGEASISSSIGEENDDPDDAVVIKNAKETTVDTGISVDSIPYIAILGAVALGGTGFMVSKKRRSED